MQHQDPDLALSLVQENPDPIRGLIRLVLLQDLVQDRGLVPGSHTPVHDQDQENRDLVQSQVLSRLFPDRAPVLAPENLGLGLGLAQQGPKRHTRAPDLDQESHVLDQDQAQENRDPAPDLERLDHVLDREHRVLVQDLNHVSILFFI